MGVSFSIPIDYAMDIADQLRSQGKVSRGWLGVSIQEITSDLAEGLGLDSPKGALVSQVMPDSPAEKAGLKERDVIIEFDGNEIIYSGDLPQTVGAIKPDTKVSALVYRDGRKKQIKVVVGELSSNSSPELSQESSLNPLGLSLKSLSSEDKRNLKILNGVKVIG
jgi:serine protease Do